MLSRVANTIYWMARYLERAENTARIINVNSHLLLDLPRKLTVGWEPIIDILSFRDDFYQSYKVADEQSVVRFMVSDETNPGSIINSLAAARENARTIREIIPREVWEQINSLYLTAHNEGKMALVNRNRYAYLNKIIHGNQMITGMLAGTMTHDEAYDFLRIGRNLERADMTTRIIDVRSASLLPDLEHEQSAFDNIQWMSVLKSLSAYQMYRREMRLRISRPDVLKFLLQEDLFPRALCHTLQQIKHCLQDLPRFTKAHEQVNKLESELLKTKPEALKQDKLHEFIDDMQLGLIKIHDRISETYF
jgi:uncharacterized alpha-E superfamily protein